MTRGLILERCASAPRSAGSIRFEPERRRSGVGPGRDAGAWAETTPGMNEVTRILSEIEPGDPSAAERLLPLVYDELRRLAAARHGPRAGRSHPRCHGAWCTRPTCGWSATSIRRPRTLLRRRRRGDAPGPRRPRPFEGAAEAGRRTGSGSISRPGPLPRRGPGLTPVARRTAHPPRGGRRRAAGSPTCTCSAGSPSTRRATSGALPTRGLSELEVCAGLAPRGPGKIIRKARDTFHPDGAL